MNQRIRWYCLTGMLAVAFVSRPEDTAKRAATSLQVTPSPLVTKTDRLDDRIIVRVDGATFTCYRFGSGQKYPYFYPVNGPESGLSLTTESSLPYPHHRSLFFGCDRVNGGNYWQEGNELGQIISKGPRVLSDGPDIVQIQDDCEWRQPGQNPVMADHRDIRIRAPSRALRFIDFMITLTALVDVKIERTNHSLFSARVEPVLSVKSGGMLTNAEGSFAEKGTYGVSSSWCDYSGKHFGVTEGIAIFDSPANPWFPSKWFTRDYGFFSPTPMEWLGEEGYRLKQADRVQLQYRVIVHAGDSRQADLASLFERWRNTSSSPASR
ncbi:MAG TPA: PmoA family protein [Acidobacteriota bacterium]|nr:PmoA family protein [Acidobacteriota bacterium]